MIKKMLMAACVLLTISSCEKEKSTDMNRSNTKELLTAKDWVVQKVEERENNSAWEDVFPFFQPCLKDNRFRFKPDYTLEYNEGPQACSPNTANQVLLTETWRLNADETVLITGGVENKILQLDPGKLVVLTTETAAGIRYETRVTYVH